MKLWTEFYRSRIGKSYSSYIATAYEPFLDLLEIFSKGAETILEVGCGIGSISKLLKQKGIQCLASDVSLDMLRLTEINVPQLKLFQYDIRHTSARNFDVIHSHGVLEHFKHTAIKRIIENQTKVCKKILHYVPSDKYSYKSFGDENLWSKEEWQDIANPNKIVEFNSGKDLCLIWEL